MLSLEAQSAEQAKRRPAKLAVLQGLHHQHLLRLGHLRGHVRGRALAHLARLAVTCPEVIP